MNLDALGLRCPGTISHEPNLKFALDTYLLHSSRSSQSLSVRCVIYLLSIVPKYVEHVAGVACVIDVELENRITKGTTLSSQKSVYSDQGQLQEWTEH